MSNRLHMAHVASGLELHGVLPAAPSRTVLARALGWLRGLMPAGEPDMSAAMRRDLGLPEPLAVPFRYDVERSRVRL